MFASAVCQQISTYLVNMNIEGVYLYPILENKAQSVFQWRFYCNKHLNYQFKVYTQMKFLHVIHFLSIVLAIIITFSNVSNRYFSNKVFKIILIHYSNLSFLWFKLVWVAISRLLNFKTSRINYVKKLKDDNFPVYFSLILKNGFKNLSNLGYENTFEFFQGYTTKTLNNQILDWSGNNSNVAGKIFMYFLKKIFFIRYL